MATTTRAKEWVEATNSMSSEEEDIIQPERIIRLVAPKKSSKIPAGTSHKTFPNPTAPTARPTSVLDSSKEVRMK
jgi:hypothetical protein